MSDEHEQLQEPAPVDVEARIDAGRVAAGLAGVIEVEDPELFGELLAGALSWSLDGFDAAGNGTVDVVRKATGARVASVRVHWTAIAGPVDPVG